MEIAGGAKKNLASLRRKEARSRTPERIRTSDLLLRRQTLYPAELRARQLARAP